MPIPLRADFDAPRLRAIARSTKDAAQTRRLLALAAVYDGARRTEAAAIGGVTLQIVRDWVMKFNAGGPDGLIDRKAPGQPSKLTEAHRTALKAVIESGRSRRLTAGRARCGPARQVRLRRRQGRQGRATHCLARCHLWQSDCHRQGRE